MIIHIGIGDSAFARLGDYPLDKRRAAVDQAMEVLTVSERRACGVIGQPRATERYPKKERDDEELLREQIVSFCISGVMTSCRIGPTTVLLSGS